MWGGHSQLEATEGWGAGRAQGAEAGSGLRLPAARPLPTPESSARRGAPSWLWLPAPQRPQRLCPSPQALRRLRDGLAGLGGPVVPGVLCELQEEGAQGGAEAGTAASLWLLWSRWQEDLPAATAGPSSERRPQEQGPSHTAVDVVPGLPLSLHGPEAEEEALQIRALWPRLRVTTSCPSSFSRGMTRPLATAGTATSKAAPHLGQGTCWPGSGRLWVTCVVSHREGRVLPGPVPAWCSWSCFKAHFLVGKPAEAGDVADLMVV